MNIIFDSQVNMAYIQIAPIKVSFMDICDCTRLYVISHDNFYNQAQITYHLACDDGVYRYTSHCTISNNDYATWPGDNSYPFTFVANCIGATIIE